MRTAAILAVIVILCLSLAGCACFKPSPVPATPASITAIGPDEGQRLRASPGYREASDASTDWVVDAMSTIRRLQTQRDSRP